MLKQTMVILQSGKEIELTDKLLEESTKKTSQGFNTMESLLQLIGLVVLLIIILAAAYFTSRFVGKMKLNQEKDSNFKVIDSYRISPTKMLQIVKIGSKYIVISIGKDTISLLTELEEKDILLKGNMDKPSFKQMLDKVRKNKG